MDLLGPVRTILGSTGRYKWQTLLNSNYSKKFIDLDIARYEDPEFKSCYKRNRPGEPMESRQSWTFTLNSLFPALVKITISASIILFFDWKILLIIVFAEVPPILNRIFFFDRAEYSIWAKERD